MDILQPYDLNAKGDLYMYTITFTDGTKFEGGSPANSLWDTIPDKPIKSIRYSLTPFITYEFKDFEAYNHCVERCMGVNKQMNKITKVIIMGAIKERVYEIIMDAKGCVYQVVTARDKEYSQFSKLTPEGKFGGWVNAGPLTGWKQGVVGTDEKAAKPSLRKITPQGETVKV